MNPERAIKILNEHVDSCAREGEVEGYHALQLGIEALIRHESQHKYPYCVIMEPLPGETKD